MYSSQHGILSTNLSHEEMRVAGLELPQEHSSSPSLVGSVAGGTINSGELPCKFLNSDRSLHHLTFFPIQLNCGSCGYALNLSSSKRNTSTIGSKYGKSIKRGIISFFSIDESRFTQIDEICCIPYFISKNSWGLFRQRITLLCRKCGNHIGHSYEDRTSSSVMSDRSSDFSSISGNSVNRKYDVKIRALQPLSS